MKTNEEIDVLIGRFLAGEATPEEAIKLIDWRESSPENEAYFQKSAHAFGWMNVEFSTDEAWQSVRSQLKLKDKKAPLVRFYWTKIAAAAAVACILIIAGLNYFGSEPDKSTRTFAATDKKQSWSLDDGTEIAVAAHSSIELEDGFGKTNRRLKLTGSGYFEVDHDEQLPFIIETGPIHIKDLGTRFDVQKGKDTIFIRVDEGSVLIYDNKGLRLTVEAGSEAYYVISAGNLQLVGKTGSTASVRTFVFDNQRLETVVNQLKQVYQADIRFSDPDLGNCKITTRFTDEPLDVVLAVIAETLDLQLVEKSEYYLLSGSACKH